MNQVALVGRITRDVEVSMSGNGREVCRFTVAVNRTFKNPNGEYDADFISCVAFGQTANFMGRYIEKGRLVSVTGRIQTGSYERDGQRIYTTDVVVDNIQGLDQRRQGNDFNQGGDFNNQGFGANQGYQAQPMNQGFNSQPATQNPYNNNNGMNQGPGEFMDQGFDASKFSSVDEELPF